jgi:glutathionyl-hydroquinone reductase
MSELLIDGELSDGEFKRQESRFRDWVGVDPRTGGRSEFPLQAGRYHLYVALACPWCHRAVILRELAGLAEALPISYLAPYRDDRGWAFTGELFSVRGEHGWTDEYVDRLHGWDFISEAYRISDPDFDGRITVPVLWDTHKSHRQQRIGRDRANDGLAALARRSRRRSRARALPGAAARGDRRAQLAYL